MVQIKWTMRARNDLQDLYRFIAKDSKRYARIQIEDIQTSVSKLADFPLIGRGLPEFPSTPYRELLIGNYRVIYKLIDEERQIYILSIVHGRQQIEKHDLS